MTRKDAPRWTRRAWTATAIVAAIVLVVSGAVMAQGYDTQRAAKVETGVWVTKGSGQYARADTDLGQLTLVRDVEAPSGVAQYGGQGIVFSQGLRRAWAVDPANPQPLVESSAANPAGANPADSSTADANAPSRGPAGSAGASTPSGTRQVFGSGEWVVYLTDAGAAFVQRLSATGSAGKPVPIAPPEQSSTAAKGKPRGYVASSVAVAADGTVALYSAEERAVRVYDATTGTFDGGAQKLTSPPPADAATVLTIAGSGWVLAAPKQSRAWLAGVREPVTTKLGADAVAAASTTGAAAYFADGAGLVAVTADRSERVATAAGTPAAPTEVGGTVYAAWVSPSGGTLWSSAAGTKTLALPDGAFRDARSLAPRILSNGGRAVLDETDSGTLWTIPSGTLIPPSQWDADNQQKSQQTQTTTQVEEVTQELPPVAQNASFGVRSGSTTLLPVLLNAHSPVSRAVLTIEPGSLAAGLSDPGFGALSLTANDQQLAIQVSAQSGSATFSYAVSDGTMQSDPATVTLHVVPDSENAAPVWCGIENCTQVWPTMTVAPGGTDSVPILGSWVDPDGDPLVLADARSSNPSAPIRVVATAEGRVVVRHTDQNAGSGTYGVTVSVMDSRGALTTKELSVSVSGAPALTIVPAAVVAGVGDTRSVSVADQIEGGSGSYRLTDAVIAAGDKDQVTVTPNAAAGTIRFSARSAGEYTVGYTVQDAQTNAEETGVVRFSVAAAGRELSMPPLSAFVRAREDTTLDVLQTVQNTSGRVLAVQSVSSDSEQLSASAVDSVQLRVSGTTADGKPGRVGTATVTIGDGSGQTVRGQVTVFLVEPALGSGPIARPDSITVREGAQVDIPVTANDIAPRGEHLVLASQIEGSGTPGELVFAAGDVVRYLAPHSAGTFTIRYSIYVESDPTRLDTAEVTVTVVPAGTNHAPEPTTLTGRVRAGGSVTLTVPSGGQDPDGDPTVLSALAQPKPGQGTATIGPDGRTIVYTAPITGVADGQVGFSYTLRDAAGATGDGAIRIAVLDGRDADVAPVTYSDHVRTVQGSPTVLTVQPLLNDRDPAGGTLSVVALEPNAPEGSAEHTRLKQLVDPSTDLRSGTVRLRAGDVQGVQSYVYTVASSATSSTAQGLIVVTVAADALADTPRVTDTVVTSALRAQLASGIDVVAGKTVWSSGRASDLTLAIWGEAAKRYTVKGHRISGPAPSEGALVPFSVTGTDQTGSATVGYGFLRIPAFDDMRLQLAPDLRPYEVGEEQSIALPLKGAVQLAGDDALQLRSDGGFVVQRANAACTPASGTRATYAAGREAPWTDTCTVQVRLLGQTTWTALPIPVRIQPKSPQARLTSVSRTIEPGTTQTIDLYGELTSWEGGRVGDKDALDYRVSSRGDTFSVTQSGRTLTVAAAANAHPGARETAQVTTTSFGGLSATVTLVVGVAPPDAPRAATFSQTCSVASGPGCSVTVIGAAGEYDPFQGKPGSGLHLVGLGQASCPVAAVSTSGSSAITVTWPASPKPAGGSCVVPYTVADAQGRTGAGTLTIDVLGYPLPPSTVTTTSFTGSSVTLLVPLGEAAQAHPAIRGVAIYENGEQVASSCAAGASGTFVCTVSGLTSGQRHTYTARSVNAVGESVDTTPVVTWAYQPPAIGEGTAATAYDPARTTASQGVIDVVLSSDEDTSGFQISIDGALAAEIGRTGTSTSWTGTAAPGTHTVTAVPVSRYQPPLGGGNTGASWSQTVQVAGAPIITGNGTLRVVSNTELRLEGVSVDANFSSMPLRVIYAKWKELEAAPTCSMASDGSPVMGTYGSDNAIFKELARYERYFVQACASNGFGAVASSVQTADTLLEFPSGGAVDYTVARVPDSSADGSRAAYDEFTAPVIPPLPSFTVVYRIAGVDTEAFVLDSNVLPGAITYRYCYRGDRSSCGAEAPVRALTAPTTVTVAVQPTCTAAPLPTDLVFSHAIQPTDYSVRIQPGAVPNTVTYTVTFSRAFEALRPAVLTRCLTPAASEGAADG